MARVRVFFYGSYMNRAVLAEVDLRPERLDVARLDGYDIRIAPRATLVVSAPHAVYGLVADATHEELARLYAHAHDVLGETYLPHPVLVQTLLGVHTSSTDRQDGAWVPALCYIAEAMAPQPADPAYVGRIVGPAREHGFPADYIERLEMAGAGRG